MMRTRSIQACAVPAILAAGFVHAQTPSPDPCAPTAISTVEVNLCAQQRFDAADHSLNAAYTKLLSLLIGAHQKDTREKLLAAQRNWIRFRDAECAAEESVWAAGSVHTAIYLDCMRTHTVQRTNELDPSNWQGG